MNKKGLLLCAKYSVAPNFFGYCGPDENKSLVDHLKENIADKEIRSILSEFETLYLNLTLIAKENKIDDIFDERVVEAYWVGNELLQNVSSRDYTQLLDEKFKLKKKLGAKNLGILSHKIQTTKIYPHHSFHVFNIFKRTGHDPSFHTLATMDECRIGWGKVLHAQNQNIKSQNSTIIVSTRPLNINNKVLMFGKEKRKTLNVSYKEQQFIRPRVGDWVSFHWGQICDIIRPEQAKNLFYYTSQAVHFYNK